jgi:SET domain-containing protein
MAAKKKTVTKKRARRSPPGRPGPVNEWMELRRSGIHGLGAFARTDIPKGTKIIEYVGEKINNAEADRRYDDEKMKRHHTFLFILNSRTCVDAAFDGNESRFLNHSCDPNCETVITRGHIWVEALKAIPAGTELVYDYQYEDDPAYTDEDLRFYACKCGSPKCRGTIVKTRRRIKP